VHLIWIRWTHCWDMTIRNLPRWLPVAILDLVQPEVAPLIRQPRRTYPRTKHELGRMIRCRHIAVQNFPKCEVGRSSVLNIHSSVKISYKVLRNSRNRQGYWLVREMGRHSAHFTNWAIRLPISWNGQFHRLSVTYTLMSCILLFATLGK